MSCLSTIKDDENMPYMYIHVCTLLVQPHFPLGSHNVTYPHRCVFILLFFDVLKPAVLPPGMSSFPPW